MCALAAKCTVMLELTPIKTNSNAVREFDCEIKTKSKPRPSNEGILNKTGKSDKSANVCFSWMVFIRVSKQWFSDPRPLTLYLYLSSALFSFCWALGTELWNQWAAACTSLGSAVKLLNPFQHSLTLMSPTRLLQTSLEECKTYTHTHTHLSTPLAPWGHA